MKLPVGKFKGADVETIFVASIKYHIDSFYNAISSFDPRYLYSNWRTIVRSVDEMINIPLELQDESEMKSFMKLNFNFFDRKNLQQLQEVMEILEKRFEKKVAIRFNKWEQCALHSICLIEGIISLTSGEEVYI